jgi:hypothetical protein
MKLLIPRAWFSSRNTRQAQKRPIESAAPCVILAALTRGLTLVRDVFPQFTYLTPHSLVVPFARLIPAPFMLA